MSRWIAGLLALWVMLSTGCSGQNAGQEETVTGERTTGTHWRADPPLALETIYETNAVKEVYTADETVLEERFLLDVSLLGEHYVRYASGHYGLADVFILRPVEGAEVKVRDQLEMIRLSRLQEAQQYDVGGALEVAQNAQVFEQGQYVVLLMVEDMESARAAINYYIPRT